MRPGVSLRFNMRMGRFRWPLKFLKEQILIGVFAAGGEAYVARVRAFFEAPEAAPAQVPQPAQASKE